MSDDVKTRPGFLPSLISFLIGLSAIVLAVFSYHMAVLIIPALVLLTANSAFKAWNKGIFLSLMSYVRLIFAFGLGWLFKTEAGLLFGIKGFLRDIAGFYALFFLSYFVIGRMIAVMEKKFRPGSISRFFGAIAGGFEGFIIGIFIFLAMTMIPGSDLIEHQPEFLISIAGSAKNLVSPLVPEKAKQVLEAVQTMTKLSGKINPEKIDQEKVYTIMQPIAEMPEIIEVQNNPEIQRMIATKNFSGLLKHPAMLKLLENPELQDKIINLDWKGLEKAVRPGMPESPEIKNSEEKVKEFEKMLREKEQR
jgi:uncharacterized membrane protein required for colicin V production